MCLIRDFLQARGWYRCETVFAQWCDVGMGGWLVITWKRGRRYYEAFGYPVMRGCMEFLSEALKWEILCGITDFALAVVWRKSCKTIFGGPVEWSFYGFIYSTPRPSQRGALVWIHGECMLLACWSGNGPVEENWYWGERSSLAKFYALIGKLNAGRATESWSHGLTKNSFVYLWETYAITKSSTRPEPGDFIYLECGISRFESTLDNFHSLYKFTRRFFDGKLISPILDRTWANHKRRYIRAAWKNTFNKCHTLSEISIWRSFYNIFWDISVSNACLRKLPNLNLHEEFCYRYIIHKSLKMNYCKT